MESFPVHSASIVKTIKKVSANQIVIFHFPEMKILYPVRDMHRITTFTAPKVPIAPKTVFDGSADAHRIFNILRLEKEIISQFSMLKLENVWSYGRSNYRIPAVHVYMYVYVVRYLRYVRNN
jgi:hypothetical protein